MKERLEHRLIDSFLKRLANELPNHSNNQKETFHAVNDKFEKDAGFKPFASYESFKNAKSRRGKNRIR